MSINGQSINGASINGAAAADEEAYQLWLHDYSAPIAHLVEQDYNDDSAVYPNWVTHTIKSSDRADLSFTGYPDRIKSIGSFSRQIGDRFTGVVQASIGEIEYENAEGRLDLWHKLSIDGQSVRVYHGHPSWARERFRLVYEGVAEKVSLSTQKSIKIQIRSIDYKFNLPIQENLIGTARPNGSANQPIPKALGKFFNAEPVCVDLVNQVYQFNDGASTSADDVRDGGISFRTNEAVISSVVGNLITTSAAHGFVANTRVRSNIKSLSSSENWKALTWNGQFFLALAYDSAICAISFDGYFWTEHALPLSDKWISVAHNGTMFVAVAESTTGFASTCITSPDGINWTTHSMPAGPWIAVRWNGSVFCAISATEATTSASGSSWTAKTSLGLGNASALEWAPTSLGAGIFCVVSNGAAFGAVSSDGLSWTLTTLPSAANWCALKWGGKFFCAISSGSTDAATSPDGVAWTARTMPAAANAIDWNGTVFCAVSYGHADAATSPDGAVWTARTLPASAKWQAVAWGYDFFCAIANNNYSTTSQDGITWSNVTGAPPNPLAFFTDYWVIPDGLTATAFKLSATRGGAVMTLSSATTGGVLTGYHWTTDLATSYLYLDQKPAGRLTMDGVAGSTDASTIVVNALSAVNIDPTSQARFQGLCAQAMGIYIKERRNRLDVAADIVNGIGGWFGHGRDGMLKFGRVDGNPASYDFELIADSIIGSSLQIEKMIPPEKKHRLSYRKNWTNQSGALFADVSADNVTLFSNDYSVTQPLDSTDVGESGAFHALGVVPDVQETLMYFGADAATEAARLDAMYFGWGAIFSCEAKRVATQFDLGHVVNVNHPRFGLGDGVTFGGGTNMTVVYVDDNPSADKVALKFFVALSAYTPGQL